MKKLFFLCLMAFFVMSAHADVQVKEKLNRAPVAVKTSQGILVSWRYLAADGDATFSVYRNGTEIATGISTKTNYLDADGKAGDTYKVVSSKGGEATCKAWSSMYTTIELERPKAVKDINGVSTGRYRPDDATVADVDGDGDYELILKWMPDNQRDSGANKGSASPTYLYCYEMDGTLKWKVDIGFNIRSGNHTVQFVVYDMDGDGKAEMLCKTAPGSTDGLGKYVSEAATDATIKACDNTQNDVNSNGLVVKGEEFLTVFNGETGAAMHTIWYSPSRNGTAFPTSATNSSSYFGDSNCNRAERFNAAVAYLDGLDKLPTAIFQRGYYKASFIWAVDWNGTELVTRWLHRGTSSTAWDTLAKDGTKLYDQDSDPVTSQGKSSYGQGVHGISIGDVNNDGYDDIVIGGASIGSDGKLLCSTGFGHGDAIHLADLVPDRPGLEIMMPHEEVSTVNGTKYYYGYDVHDATTGEVLISASCPQGEDNGRGLACDFIPSHKGSEFWSACTVTTKANSSTGSAIKDNNIYPCEGGAAVYSKRPDTNFRIYWTGDPFDQTFDGSYNSTTLKASPRIRNWNTASGAINTFQEFSDYGNPLTCNTTKATPCLQADILGDWREELIMMEYEDGFSASKCKLHIYSTPEPTEYKVPCLMEDHMYRMGVVWQNASYNQPPHLGYSLAESLGIDRSTYVTSVKNHAPTADGTDPSAPLTERITAPGTDKSVQVGTCYTAGENGELTEKTSGNFVKMRTNNNNNTITIKVNDGYIIEAINIEAYSNNTSTLADRSIDMTGVYVDGSATSVLDAVVTFPGGTAGQDAQSKKIEGLGATQNIVLSFDNSRIDSSDSAGKNKQLFAIITLYYKASSAVQGVAESASETVKVKVIRDGKLYIIRDGKQYNAAGQRVE